MVAFASCVVRKDTRQTIKRYSGAHVQFWDQVYRRIFLTTHIEVNKYTVLLASYWLFVVARHQWMNTRWLRSSNWRPNKPYTYFSYPPHRQTCLDNIVKGKWELRLRLTNLPAPGSWKPSAWWRSRALNGWFPPLSSTQIHSSLGATALHRRGTYCLEGKGRRIGFEKK